MQRIIIIGVHSHFHDRTFETIQHLHAGPRAIDLVADAFFLCHLASESLKQSERSDGFVH